MSLKGAIRSYNAAVRRAEKESARRERDRQKQHKADMKRRELDDAENAVDEYQDLMDALLGYHRELFSPIDWSAISREDEPTAPFNSEPYRKQAQADLDNFRPSFFQKLFGMEGRARADLLRRVTLATESDQREYSLELKKYHGLHEEWTHSQKLSKGVLQGEFESYLAVIDTTGAFNELKEAGSIISIEFVNRFTLLVNVKFAGDKIIPTESKELLKSGKLSVKKIPTAKINAIYQDHVCSGILSVAAELFAILPINTVYINARITMLDPASGHLKDFVVVSAMIPQSTMLQLNLQLIDPSDAMRNFKCNMDFKASTGFLGVDEIRYSGNEVA